MKIFITIFIIYFCSPTAAQIAGLKSNKLVEEQNNRYRIKACRNVAILLKENCKKEATAYFKLPMSITDSQPVAYDIAGKYIYTVSIFGTSPIDYYFNLNKCSLADLDTFYFNDTLKIYDLNFFNVNSLVQQIDIIPLFTAFSESSVNDDDSVFFDLVVRKEDNLNLVVWQKNELQLWEYKDENWVNTKTSAAPFKGHFIAAYLKDKLFITAGSEIFMWENDIKKIETTQPGLIYMVSDNKKMLTASPANIGEWSTTACELDFTEIIKE
jgi:hypothetical protein